MRSRVSESEVGSRVSESEVGVGILTEEGGDSDSDIRRVGILTEEWRVKILSDMSESGDSERHE